MVLMIFFVVIVDVIYFVYVRVTFRYSFDRNEAYLGIYGFT